MSLHTLTLHCPECGIDTISRLPIIDGSRERTFKQEDCICEKCEMAQRKAARAPYTLQKCPHVVSNYTVCDLCSKLPKYLERKG